MPSLKITLTKSMIGFEKTQGRTARALGLKRVGATAIHADSESIRGMIFKIVHAVRVESVDGVEATPTVRTPRKRHHGPHHGDGVNG